MTKFGRFQSLIGSTKEQMHDILPDGKEPFVSITHRYGSTTVFTSFYVFIIPYFYCFSIFFSKKSVNLFIENSRKALILLAFLFLSKLARRFTDFFTEFLAISCLNVQL